LELFVRGDVVVVPFPFNNLSDQKMRPALVLADLAGPDLILCQITSKPARDRYSVTVDAPDFSEGSLKYTSNVRANQIFTLEKTLIRNCVGRLKKEKTEQVVQVVISFLRS
jgi:mRNA interferase MazF